MFCKWCGNKITNNGVPCPHCGKTQDSLENGNGFWDICSSKPETGESSFASNKASVENLLNSFYAKNKSDLAEAQKKDKIFRIASIVSCVLSAISILLISVLLINQLIFSNGDLPSSADPENNVPEEIVEDITGEDETEETPEDDDISESKDMENLLEERIKNGKFDLSEEKMIELNRYDTNGEYFLFVASGNCLSEEDVNIFWQKKSGEDGEWEILPEKTNYLAAEKDDNSNYRIICAVYNDETDDYDFYYSQYSENQKIEKINPESDSSASSESSESNSGPDDSSSNSSQSGNE